MAETLHTLRVDLSASARDRSYPIRIGRGLLSDTGLWADLVAERAVLLVSDDRVAPLYGEALKGALAASSSILDVVLPAGEASKHMGSVQAILDRALEARLDRTALFIALGGGVVGDMTGFAAACFLRGADFIQVPTTLLAQVDSSVGGKTGINHAMGKNLIGAFHQPSAVIVDLQTLHSLSEREYAAGLAEVIKYGLIRDPEFFGWLLKSVPALKARDDATLAKAIERSCAIKAEIVALDEREAGIRAHLNLGHTFGHAIERLQGYGAWLHGEAVAAGMVMAARLSAARGGLEQAVVDQLIEFNRQVGLPVAPPDGLSAEALIDAMTSDKKVSGGKIRYVLLRSLGDPELTDAVSKSDIEGLFAA